MDPLGAEYDKLRPPRSKKASANGMNEPNGARSSPSSPIYPPLMTSRTIGDEELFSLVHGLEDFITIPTFTSFGPIHQSERDRQYAYAAQSRIKAWTEGHSLPWILLTGPSGTGKTHLLAAAIASITWRAYYLTADTFDRRIKEFQRPVSELIYIDPDFWVSERLGNVHHLAIDDIGSGHGFSDYTRQRWERLIDLRYRREAPTLFATNLTRTQLTEALGTRVMSRLSDTSLVEEVPIPIEDVRPTLGIQGAR